MEQIHRLLKDLENDISSENFIKLYQQIREKHPPIRSYITPRKLIDCLHNQANPDYALKDKILSSLIYEYQSQLAPQLIGSYIFILFKPGLLRLFAQFRHRARQFSSIGDIDLWFQIMALFFEELSQVQEEAKIASKITGRIKNRLRDYFKGLFRSLYAEAELKDNPEMILPSLEEVGTEAIEDTLKRLVSDSVISETDKHILLAAKVYGRSMKELSEGLKGISYANIRQRKARARKAIKAYYNSKVF
jgi:DNA-directed RNA polymerase specialized sigma24 family protein